MGDLFATYMFKFVCEAHTKGIRYHKVGMLLCQLRVCGYMYVYPVLPNFSQKHYPLYTQETQ